MALVGVISPNPSQRKKTTWDKVAEGIQIANSVLGTGLNAAKIYNDFEQTDIDREKLGYQRDALNIEKQKASISLLDKLEKSDASDPLAFEMDIESAVNPGAPQKPEGTPKSFWKVKGVEIESNDFFDQLGKGNMRILNDPSEVADLRAKRFPVSDIRVKGVPAPFTVVFDQDKIKENLNLGVQKIQAENAKTQAETQKIKKETEELGKQNMTKGTDELRKEFEARPEIKGARDVIAIADRADELVKSNSVSDQVALAYGFIRAQSPGVVSQNELDLVSRGALSDELMQKFGWKRFADGRFMTDEQMRGAADTLKTSAKSLMETIKPTIQTYSRMARERGFNVDDVVLPLNVRQSQLFKEMDPSYLLKKDPNEMTPLEREIFEKAYGKGKK